MNEGIPREIQTDSRTECAAQCLEMKECVGFSYEKVTADGAAQCHLSLNKCDVTFYDKQGSQYFTLP